MIEETPKKHYMAWMTLAMLDFVTIIRFEDVFYPYQNQGLSVIFSWIFLLICYQLPYTLIATQLGLAYKDTEEGGPGLLDPAGDGQRRIRLRYQLDVLGPNRALPGGRVQLHHRFHFLDDPGQQHFRQAHVTFHVRPFDLCHHLDIYLVRKCI